MAREAPSTWKWRIRRWSRRSGRTSRSGRRRRKTPQERAGPRHRPLFDGLAIKDSLALYEDGKLRRGVVATAKTLGDVEAREGDWITLYPGGALNRLELNAGPRSLKGYTCKGSENYFHENGQPKEPCGVMTP